MARIELENVAHSYVAQPAAPSDYALRPLHLTWRDGGAYALLGPSGSGKSTMLNILSGLLRPTEGRVLFDGRDVTGLEPRERNIAQVFQFPVIYDTMTVYDNLAFPLRNRGLPEPDIKVRVGEIAAILDLSDDLRFSASGLSADVKQKISMGRGLVRKDVAAILFDEPLTVIDPHVKFLLRRKLKQIHEQLGLTLIYVTHDQNEALTFADHVVVLSEGAAVQQGTPQDLFECPLDAYVGHFIGSPGMNLLPCSVDGAEAVLEGGGRVPLAPEEAAGAGAATGTLALGIRPEFIRLSDRASDLAAAVTDVEERGGFQIVTAVLENGRSETATIRIKVPDDRPVGSGQALRVAFPTGRTKIYADGKAVHVPQRLAGGGDRVSGAA